MLGTHIGCGKTFSYVVARKKNDTIRWWGTWQYPGKLHTHLQFDSAIPLREMHIVQIYTVKKYQGCTRPFIEVLLIISKMVSTQIFTNRRLIESTMVQSQNRVLCRCKKGSI